MWRVDIQGSTDHWTLGGFRKTEKEAEELYDEYPCISKAKVGDIVYLYDNYGSEWEIFGKILEITGDNRWEPADLEFRPYTLTEEDQDEVVNRLLRVFEQVEERPKLYVFTYYS